MRDLRFDRRGLVVTLRRSKTDQAGEGREIGIPFVDVEQLCAARAVRRWLDVAGIVAGPVFRAFDMQRRMLATPIAGRDVARLLQRLTARRAFPRSAFKTRPGIGPSRSCAVTCGARRSSTAHH